MLFCLKLQEMLWLNWGGWFPIIHNWRQTQRKFSQPPQSHPVSQTSRCIHSQQSGSWSVVLVSNEHCSFISIHIMWSHFNLPFCHRSKTGITVTEVTFTNIYWVEINEETDCLTQRVSMSILSNENLIRGQQFPLHSHKVVTEMIYVFY